MTADQPTVEAERLERWREVRTTRQLVITKHEPITYRAIIDQSVIRRATIDSDAGLPQLRFLTDGGVVVVAGSEWAGLLSAIKTGAIDK